MPEDPFCHYMLFIAPAYVSKSTCFLSESDSLDLYWDLGSSDV